MVNAEIHYFMMNQEEKKGMHRYNYRERLCCQLFDTDWSLYDSMTNNDVLDAINQGQKSDDNSDHEDTTNRTSQKKKSDNAVACTPLMVNQYLTHDEDTEVPPVKTYKGVCCQVCLFEGRKTRTKSVAFCGTHGIRACLTTPNLLSYKDKNFQNAVEQSTNEELAIWRCPNVSDSCWIKAHHFYIDKGLWGKTSTSLPPNDHKAFRHHGVKVSSELYKSKQDWMLRHQLISKKARTRGRKSRKRTKTTKTDHVVRVSGDTTVHDANSDDSDSDVKLAAV
jgi:hypothetical protein